MKDSFILHHDTLSVIDELSDEQVGKIIKEIYNYSLHLNNPDEVARPNGLPGLLSSVAHPFKKQLDRDLKAYNKQIKDNSEKGKLGNLKRWHRDLYDLVIGKSLTLESAEKIAKDRQLSPPDPQRSPSNSKDRQLSPTVATIADNDSDSDSDIKEIEIDKSISSKKKNKKFNLSWFKNLDFSDLQNNEPKFYDKLKGIESMLGLKFSCQTLNLEREKCINWSKSKGKQVKDWKATFSNWMINRKENNKNEVTNASNNSHSGIRSYRSGSIDDQMQKRIAEINAARYAAG